MTHVNGFSIQEHGSGYHVTLSVFIGALEVPPAWLEGLLDRNPVFGLVTREGETDGEVDTSARASGRSTQKGKEDTAPEPAPAEGDASKPRRRYRRRAPADASTEDRGDKADERPRRRRQRQKSAPEAPTGDQKTDDAGRAAGSRKSSGSPSDQDLTKAASEGAQVAGTHKVMETLEQFGVSRLDQLKPDQRIECFTMLKELYDG